ncbi:hypothetical protein [uncultured Brevundimonas sp.]|uniref:hypothetical protein n=1 Tax=uncultured Brevundimonas sp. TaxID=213418 RepID=UPI0030EE397E|tara:strand:+ start:57626 stop:57796 length:171 start_codon:yes stop_codon:yes gene_type:complete
MRLSPEQLSARKKRNGAIAGVLVAFIVLIFTVTVLNLKRNVEASAALNAAAVVATP